MKNFREEKEILAFLLSSSSSSLYFEIQFGVHVCCLGGCAEKAPANVCEREREEEVRA